MTKRVLVLWFSQSGQLGRVAEAFTQPLTDAGHEVCSVELKPLEPFPFPWKVTQFFGIFPETVREVPVALEPVQIPDGPWDRVILCSQIWFLSPSAVVASFLRSDAAAVLDGVPVLTLIGCRNMWVNGWRRLVRHIEARGGRVTDRVVVTHSGSIFASYFSTLAWMLTGKRETNVLPKAEIDESRFGWLAELGAQAATRLDQDVLFPDTTTASVSHMHALGEQFAARLFPLLAAVYAATSSPGSFLRHLYAVNQMTLTISLVFLLLVPCFVTRLLFGRWLDPWLERLATLPLHGDTPGQRALTG
ncbi:MAG: hypothetical protein GY913_03875 [Proteobacteria bacterium]|nr:hypothetical protein [Pseudomonadota bacterium]